MNYEFNDENQFGLHRAVSLIKAKSIILVAFIVIFMTLDNSSLLASNIFEDSKLCITPLYGFDFHDANTKIIDGISSCCDDNFSGNGNTFSISIDYGVKVTESGFLSFLIGYSDKAGELEILENTVINLDSTAIDGTFSHNLDFSYSSFIFGFQYQQDLAGTIGIGSSILVDVPIKSSYNYSENIVLPIDRGVFPDTETRRRNELNGNLAHIKGSIIQLNVFLGKELPLDSDFVWLAFPKIGINYMFSGLNNNEKWSSISFYFGVSISRTKIF